MEEKLYKRLAVTVQAFKTCQQTKNELWEGRHKESIKEMMSFLPHGSGFDSGTKLNYEKSSGEKLVFDTAFHHMNDGGFYDGWTNHTVTVRPSLSHGLSLSISGPNRNDIKELMYQEFDCALTRIVGIAPDPFADVPDYERCANCYGKASVTVDDRRYCNGCGNQVRASIHNNG